VPGSAMRPMQPFTIYAEAATYADDALLARLFENCQREAFVAGKHAGKTELLKIAVDTENRVRQLVTSTASQAK